MPKPSSPMAVLFCDICQSTRLYLALGDQRAQGLIAEVVEAMGQAVAEAGGRVIKTVGDEVMASFPEPGRALEAAVAMQQRVAGFPPPGPGLMPLCLHAGLHWGQVIAQGGDIFGDAVNVAARLRSLAKTGQILTSGPTLEAAEALAGLSTRLLARTTVRGRHKEMDVFEVLWEVEGLTSYTPLAQPGAAPACLRLRLGGQEVEVGPGRPVVNLGRGPANDLIVLEACVSRSHARVEWRRGKFVLVDQSTNGTFLRLAGGRALYLKLEETPLEGAGIITLGCEGDESLPQAIHFQAAEPGHP